MLNSYINDLNEAIKRTEKEIIRIEEDIGLERIKGTYIKSAEVQKKQYEESVERAKVSITSLNQLLNRYNNIIIESNIGSARKIYDNKELHEIENKFMDIFQSVKKNLL